MAYKIPNLPTLKATEQEIVDFLEFKCLTSIGKSYSVTEVLSDMGISGEDDEYDGMADDCRSDSLMEQVSHRQRDMNGRYPFLIGNNAISCDVEMQSTMVYDVYLFLLLATRLDMSGGGRIRRDIDGTKLFERLCALVLGNYFGHVENSFVFGTGREDGMTFEGKMNDFIARVQEFTVEFQWPPHSSKQQKDAKVDIVTCIPFMDRNGGNFIALGQCKTGTSWPTYVSTLAVESFCCYLSRELPVKPLVVFMVAESFLENWEQYQAECHGLFFNRERIMQYLPLREVFIEADSSLLNDIQDWNKEVLSSIS